jgi:hypothetical protein
MPARKDEMRARPIRPGKSCRARPSLPGGRGGARLEIEQNQPVIVEYALGTTPAIGKAGMPGKGALQFLALGSSPWVFMAP